MSGGSSYKKHEERGAWFEIKCIKDVILSREARGEEAFFERDLLKSWSKYKGYETAQDALDSLGKSKIRRVKQ